MKSHDFWLLFDDDIVEVSESGLQYGLVLNISLMFFPKTFRLRLQKIDAQAIEEFYGLTSEISKNSESGYILFYQSRD